jgi:hypothetical protein
MKLTFAVLGSLLLAGLVVSAARSGNDKESTTKQQETTAKYSVVSTDAAHLIVTDNSSNTLYFYAVEAGGSPGDELNLRGKIDLNAVGADVLKVGKTSNEKKK